MPGPPLHTDTIRTDPTEPIGWEEAWVRAFSFHAIKRFETRALVHASVGGAQPVPLAYIYALEGGGLILSIADPDDLTPGAPDHAQERAHHELWSPGRGTGQNEIWLSRPEQAVFTVKRPEEGAFSTGFGRLGRSRTPDLILPRSTHTPKRKLHHDHF